MEGNLDHKEILEAVQRSASQFAQLSSLIAALVFASIIIIISSENKGKILINTSNTLTVMISSLFLTLVSAFAYTLTTSNIYPAKTYFSMLVAHHIFAASVLSVFLAVFWLIYSHRNSKRSFKVYLFIFISVSVLTAINITHGSYNLLSAIGYKNKNEIIFFYPFSIMISLFIGLLLKRFEFIKRNNAQIVNLMCTYSVIFVVFINIISGYYFFDIWLDFDFLPPFWLLTFLLAALSMFIVLAQIAAPHWTSQDPHAEET